MESKPGELNNLAYIMGAFIKVLTGIFDDKDIDC